VDQAVTDVSVLIPARNEQFLRHTVLDVLKNRRAKTEIIVVCDGALPLEPLEQHQDVHIVLLPESRGQRAATNLAARLSDARYVMKLDAHCAVDEGFDTKLVEAGERLGPFVTQIPAQHNLHVFDWVCTTCRHRMYQGPTPQKCAKCGVEQPQVREIVWKARRRRTEFWRFDSDLHFQYWGGYKDRPEAKGEVVDVMTSLGACFFMRRSRFMALGGLDEAGGIWGQFGVEIALKSWLSGGRHVVNKGTWFSHCFRTQGADFGFPYPLSGHQVDQARSYSKSLWLRDAWSGQARPLRWLLEKFAPVPGWTAEQIAALPSSLRERAA
jgi:glycosyltransferase involved in cell wall biosynthesis